MFASLHVRSGMTEMRFAAPIKRWRRQWKVAAIAEENPDWNDLYREIGI